MVICELQIVSVVEFLYILALEIDQLGETIPMNTIDNKHWLGIDFKIVSTRIANCTIFQFNVRLHMNRWKLVMQIRPF